jgi:hypothetical protein
MSSGDPVADKQRRAGFLKAYEEKNRLVTEKEKTIVVLGKNDWPFPIPVVKRGDKWVFDTDAGREEILNRRIGENELNVIQVCLALVDAQREYAMKDRDGSGVCNTPKFLSDLERMSLLGAGRAKSKSSRSLRSGKGPGRPAASRFHISYYYRILRRRQRRSHARSYLAKDKMIGGFGVVAYPAQYGNSGVMTFIVNYQGKVFQKNLGKDTASIASALAAYNPDSTWTEVKQ